MLGNPVGRERARLRPAFVGTVAINDLHLGSAARNLGSEEALIARGQRTYFRRLTPGIVLWPPGHQSRTFFRLGFRISRIPYFDFAIPLTAIFLIS
jgi:hypothetical protein